MVAAKVTESKRDSSFAPTTFLQAAASEFPQPDNIFLPAGVEQPRGC